MSSTGRVFFFPSTGMVYDDKIIPVILELARQGNRVHTVFQDSDTYAVLRGSRTYLAWLSRLTRLHVLARGQRGAAARIASLLKFLNVWRLLAWHRDYLAFFDTKPVSKLLNLLVRTAKRRGHVVLFTGRYFDFKAVFDGQSVEAEVAKKLQKRSVELEEYAKACHAILLYHPSQAEKYKNFGKVVFKTLYYPKMQDWWKDFMVQYPPEYEDERLAQAKEYVSVFLTHYGNYFFEESTDLDTFLRDIIAAVRKALPEVLIVVKPKVTVDMPRLQADLASIGDRNLLVTMTPVTLLAEKSLVGITVCHTSAQFEFAWSGAPWVEYCRYSGFWKELYPQVTYTDRFGGVYCRYHEELEECLAGIRERRYDLAPLQKVMDFRQQSIDFNFFYQLEERSDD